MNDQKTRESPTSIRIYLFTINGKFLWANHQTKSGENEAILISSLIAAINNFASEFLGEPLHTLKLNELNINLFNILDQFFVAFIFPNYVDSDFYQTDIIINEILKLQSPTYYKDLDERLPVVIAVLTELDENITSWLQAQSRISEGLTFSFSEIISILDEFNVAFSLYSPNGFRIYKYFPESSNINDLNYPLLTNDQFNTAMFLRFKNGLLHLNNMLVYFNTIETYLAVLIKKTTSPLAEPVLNEFQQVFKRITKVISPSLQ